MHDDDMEPSEYDTKMPPKPGDRTTFPSPEGGLLWACEEDGKLWLFHQKPGRPSLDARKLVTERLIDHLLGHRMNEKARISFDWLVVVEMERPYAVALGHHLAELLGYRPTVQPQSTPNQPSPDNAEPAPSSLPSSDAGDPPTLEQLKERYEGAKLALIGRVTSELNDGHEKRLRLRSEMDDLERHLEEVDSLLCELEGGGC